MSLVIRASKGKSVSVSPVEEAANRWLGDFFTSVSSTILEWEPADGPPTESRYRDFWKDYLKRNPVELEDAVVASSLVRQAKHAGLEMWLAQASKRKLL